MIWLIALPLAAVGIVGLVLTLLHSAPGYYFAITLGLVQPREVVHGIGDVYILGDCLRRNWIRTRFCEPQATTNFKLGHYKDFLRIVRASDNARSVARRSFGDAPWT